MLSRRVRSAIAAMVDVAQLARGRPLPAKALAAADGVAPRQLETVLQDLVRAGLLRSIRGPQGGYALARERRRISIGDVVRAIEREPSAAPSPAHAAIDAAIAEASAAFLLRLDTVSIEDLCKGAQDPATTAGDFDI